MKFQFDSNQEFQLIPIKSVKRLFEGQPKKKDLPLLIGEYGTFGNELIIDKDRVFNNLQEIQKENNIPFELRNDSFDFSIEMETGTGKTYTYFRTIFELNVEYGWSKFIIIVPSISIKEGVLKTYEMTKEHFENLYSGIRSNCYEYDSKKPNQIKSFGRDTNINIMVMTLHSFNKDTNVIKQTGLDGFEDTPISHIQKTKPIVILDEPQNMESEKSKLSISELSPLFTLRYSGTHKNYYNLLYRLSPYESYQNGLVKKIEVISMKEKFNFNKPHIKVVEIGKDNNKNKPFFTKIECFVKKDGETFMDIITLRQGERKITPDDGNKKRPLIKLKNDILDSPEFKELWKRISTKTRYKIQFDSNELIESCIEHINDEVSINEIVYQVDTFDITMNEKTGISGDTKESGIINTSGYMGDLPNLVEELKKETNLTNNTIKSILNGIDEYLIEDFLLNPQDFIYQVSKVINNQKTKLLLDGIEYEELKNEDGEIIYYDQSLFTDFVKTPENKIVDIDKIEDLEDIEDKKKKSLYDSIVIDSDNERNFTEEFVKNPNIKLFVKLPNKFYIPTPIGNYNPDWGYIKEEKNPMSGKLERTLYFVGETKTSKDDFDLRPRETFKIKCSEKHFSHTLRDTPDTDYKVLSKVSEI
jgi:restriction endonuclease